MKSSTLSQPWDKLEKEIASYQDLGKKKEELEERLRKVEKEKNTVSEKIYTKVKTEYEKELNTILEKISPLEEEISQAREEMLKESKKITARIRDLEEKIAEYSFRHKVGEFSSEKLATMQAPLKNELEEKKRKEESLACTLRKIGMSREAPRTAHTEPSHPRERARTRKTEKQPPDAASDESTVDATSKEAEASEDWIENPTNWMEDLRGENSKEENSEEEHTLKDNPDSLSMLADPSDDSVHIGEQIPEISEQERGIYSTDGPKRFPSLIVTTGMHSGKKIPVPPTTMTIGREHDNNIELKDDQVSRYHARIVYENGNYILQDLESSTGSWVNDEKITKTPLKDADKIRFGNTEMIFDFH